MNEQQRLYIIGVFGKPATQRAILAVDYNTAYKTARTTFPGESVFAVSEDAVAVVSNDPTPPQPKTRRRHQRR